MTDSTKSTSTPAGTATPELLQLAQHARSEARGKGALLGVAGFTIIAILATIFVWLESFRYFSPEFKTIFLTLIGGLGLLLVVGILGMYWLLKRQQIESTKPENLALQIGEKLPEIGDRILNAVQLSNRETPDGISDSLHQAAVQSGIKVIEQVPGGLLFPTDTIYNYLKKVGMGVAVLLLLYVINFQDTNAAIARLSQPEVAFEYPLPLELNLKAETHQVLAGDSLMLTGMISGRSLDKVELIIQTRKDTSIFPVDVTDERFKLPMNHLLTSFTAIARVANNRSWEPWEEIRSNVVDVQVINRPLVQDLTVRIRPPSYTRLPTEIFTRNIMDISGFKGSRISLEGLASKDIASGAIHFENSKSIPLEMMGTRFKVAFTLNRADQAWIELVDHEDVNNLDPLVYPIYVSTDVAPIVRVLVPGQDVIIGDNMVLPTRLKLDDDFGFSSLELNYEIQHPDYLVEDTTIYKVKVDLPRTDLSSLEFNFTWDLNDVSMMPEDAIQYWYTVWDNNSVDGYQKASSQKWLARLPSLDEMFEEIAQGNEQVKQEQEDILEVVKEIKEKVSELALEVQKDPNLSWEQQQEASEAIEQVKDLKEQLENISEQLDQMMTSAEEQNLFSDETLDKYAELQQLMEQLITPELQEAMERLQEAMEQDNPREMEAALEDFQSAMENFQKSVERTLEIFKQVEIEQKIDELATRLNDLAERQETLNSDIQDGDTADAAMQEEKISNDFDKAQELAETLEDLLDQSEDLSSESVQDLQEQMEQEQISQNLEEAASLMESGQMSQAMPPSEQAEKSLKKMAAQSGEMQSALQQQMMAEVMSEFRSALLKTLRLSQSQEDLEGPTSRTSRQSSLLRDYADSQMGLMQGLQQLSAELQELGNKTFAVSPSMGRSMGSIQAHMQEAIKGLEARNPRQSSQSQAAARESLNRMARQLANSMESLQQSGESSGFSEYMQQLQQMAGQQQGLNQQTMMQMGAGSPSMMQQLARQQMQLREALKQIENGMGSDSRMLGDLGKIGDEMEEVAKKLQGKRPSQKIHEQQERILSRLLDAQRSATKKDFSKKRKSETAGTNPFWTGRDDLPEDLGETRNQLYEELIFSLKQDYTREEQALIREYFNRLEAELNE
ncbi:MAG: hypothetical protein HN995_00135 [Candidatus Marinimicrobia bacterium]|jgi:hypothetical protein|nr:hypothetical protein [Candidatus Neomarinimicrobiota bacterium]MBT3574457.1 hypothetical protein [Candidatus Neomarinimicrobiota bacterium]MBT3681420.1 hypothetical protein [Candidatus Neomarinimicrobiota bacterium]MBT3952184.1 hypothetical protein [Candidatus Neomarinimicrobiota bacterium]MBT4253983.1 hypothetical protein [Candidatus Neomarinimicrobiota bacterium]